MLEELDPNKYHVLSPVKRKRLFIFGAVFVFLIMPVLFFYYYKLAIYRPSQTSREITLEIKKGEGVTDISKELARLEAINSEFLFNAYVFMNGFDNNIQAGVYTVKAGTNLVDLVDLLQHGKNDIKTVFLEGWRSEEFALELVNNLSNIDHEEFIAMAKPHEGYLFPDTYFFNSEVQEEDVLKKLTETFNQKTAEALTTEKLNNAGLTREQAVILASIIEREVVKKDDKEIVAGILIKRWQDGMKLDADATTQYTVALSNICKNLTETSLSDPKCVPTMQQLRSVSWWPQDLTLSDLDTDSPFNTRKNVGLPPAPISNPGLDSLEAVINHKSSPYYYYLTDSEGNVFYAKTLEEHNKNIAEHLN